MITLSASISKKVPIAGLEYASRQASITISGEVTDEAQVRDAAARLYATAEAVVDRQLGLTAAAASSSVGASPPASSNTQPAARTASTRQPGRRSTPVSPAQLRYLRQLIDREPSALPRILADYQVDSVDQLSARDASTVIDRLKGAPA